MLTNLSISDASLKWLKMGERVVIARIKGANPSITDQLRRLGLAPGTPITVEQRSPRFLVRTREGPLALTQGMIEAIYVRAQAA